MREQGDKIPSPLKQEVEGKLQALRTALQGKDMEQVRRTMAELSQSVQKIGAAVYQQPGTPPPGGEPTGETKPPEGTIEGEFREV